MFSRIHRRRSSINHQICIFFVYRVPISKGKADKRKCCFG